jgi:hypothetical protein
VAVTTSDTGRRADLLTARALLDDALVGLTRVEKPAPPIAAARDEVAQALEHVYRALANRTDYAIVRDEAELAMERTREALGALQYRETTDQGVLADIGLVAQALGVLRSNARIPEEVVLDLPRRGTRDRARASVGEPTAVDLDRDVLVPAVPLQPIEEPPAEVEVEEPPEPEIRSAEDLARYVALVAEQNELPDDETKRTMLAPPRTRREIDPASLVRRVYGTPETKEDVIGNQVDGFIEDLGMMSVMRQADEDDVWHELAPVERRLLARVDAIAAAGPVYFSRLVDRLGDSPITDPQMAWAAVYFFGSLRGTDAVDQVVRLVRSFDLEEEAMFASVSDAIAFVPNRGIEAFVRTWLDDPSETRRAFALRVLGRRAGLAILELAPRFTRDLPRRIHAELLRALETAAGPIDPELLRPALAGDDPLLFSLAAECGLARGVSASLVYARGHLKNGRNFGNSALVCALAGTEPERDLLIELALAEPTDSVIEALGWSGSVKMVGFLIGRLRAGAKTSLAALQRLTGASIAKGQPVVEELEPAERPFVRGHRPPEPEIELDDDPERWELWWEEYGAAASHDVRYRYGHAWSVADNLWELSDAPGSSRTRRLAWLELAARTGIRIPFDAQAFVVRQRRQVHEWKEALAVRRERAPVGRWTSTFT